MKFALLAVTVCTALLAQEERQGTLVAVAPSVQKYVRTEVGQEVNPDLIAQDLDLMNRNPFRKAEAVYAPGKEPGTTEVSIVSEEKRPYRIYTRVDNNGVAALDNSRFFTGFSVGNLFDQDHTFAFEYKTSGNFSQLQSFKANYDAPLPWRHIVKAEVKYANTKANDAVTGNVVRGNSYSSAVRYAVPFATTDWKREVSAGFDYKNANNEQEYVSQVDPNKSDINLFQLAVESAFGLKKDSYELELNSGLFASPGAFLPRQDADEYGKLRQGATASWAYGKGEVKYKQKLFAGFATALQLTTQLSTSKLLPSEQKGLGGVDTVRGFTSHKVNLDETFIGNFEFQLPAFPVISLFTNAPKDEIRFLVFTDAGWGFERGTSDQVLIDNLLMSFGPAVRYKMDPYISLKADWGVKVHQNGVFGINPGLVHFSATASF